MAAATAAVSDFDLEPEPQPVAARRKRGGEAATKVHTSALCIVLPRDDDTAPVHALRAKHDRQIERWP